MQYKVITKKRIVPRPVVFQCEDCGEVNVVINPFTVSSSYSTKGFGASLRDSASTDRLYEKESALHSKVVKQIKRRNVKDAGLVCTCTKCHKTPKWSQFRVNFLDKSADVLTYIAILIALFLALPLLENKNHYDSYNFNPYIIPLILFLLGQVPRFLLYSYKRLRVITMDGAYLPIVCENAEELIKFAKKHEIPLDDPAVQSYLQSNKKDPWGNKV